MALYHWEFSIPNAILIYIPMQIFDICFMLLFTFAPTLSSSFLLADYKYLVKNLLRNSKHFANEENSCISCSMTKSKNWFRAIAVRNDTQLNTIGERIQTAMRTEWALKLFSSNKQMKWMDERRKKSEKYAIANKLQLFSI